MPIGGHRLLCPTSVPCQVEGKSAWTRTLGGSERKPSRDRRMGVAEWQGSLVEPIAQAGSAMPGAADIPRKPNYDFERRERERSKAAEAAKKAQAKADKRAAEHATPDPDQPADP